MEGGKQIVLEYAGRQYTIVDEWTDCDDPASSHYMWTVGNYGCDCNRANFINQQHGTNIPEDCGMMVSLVDAWFMEAKDAEIAALKASRDRLWVAFLAAMRCYHADSWERPETIREINDALEAACDALQDSDLADADADPAPDAGQEVG